jgi:uncharacterized protein YggE
MAIGHNENMNPVKLALPFIVIIFFFLCLFAFVKLMGPIPFSVDSTQTTKTDTFSVTGTGKSSQKPDSATVTVGVTSNGQTVEDTQSKMNTAINKVSQAIKAVGIDPADIQTANYNVNPNYVFTGGKQGTDGYNASTNLTIKIKDVDNVNKVIDAATQNGATQVGGVDFKVADESKAQNEARAAAVADAKKKAQDAASIAGFKLGRVLNYTEDLGGGFPRPVPMAMDAAGTSKSVPTQVEPGSNEIQVTVTLSYQIL